MVFKDKQLYFKHKKLYRSPSCTLADDMVQYTPANKGDQKMTTENAAAMTLDRLEFNTPAGVPVSIGLSSPLTLPAGRYSPYAVCRMCAVRLSLKTLERLLLLLVLDELECGVPRPHSYEELGRTLSKCAHSVKSAMSALRAAGLVVTSRVGFGEGSVSVSCDAFLRWAERAFSAVSENAAGVTENSESVSKTPDGVTRNSESVPRADESVTARVSGRTRPRRVRKTAPPAAKKEDTSMQAVPPGLPPQTYAAAMSDDAVAPVEDRSASGPVEDFDPPVDGSEEVRGTLAAAGRVAGSQGDEDDFSFGSETAETDIGHGVKMNPDL